MNSASGVWVDSETVLKAVEEGMAVLVNSRERWCKEFLLSVISSRSRPLFFGLFKPRKMTEEEADIYINTMADTHADKPLWNLSREQEDFRCYNNRAKFIHRPYENFLIKLLTAAKISDRVYLTLEDVERLGL